MIRNIHKTIVILLLTLVNLHVNAEKPPHQHHRQTQINRNSAPSGEAWKTADDLIKEEFIAGYEVEDDDKSLFKKFMSKLGARAMLDYLELNNPRCHGEAHKLGEAIYEHNKDLGKSLMICGNKCTNACMHGVMGEAFGDGNIDEIIDQMETFCSQREMAKLHKPGNCAHGFGHALMITANHNLIAALNGCENFKSQSLAYYCATGIFMEYRNKLRTLDFQGEFVKGDNAQYPCDQFPNYAAACYRYMLFRISKNLNADRDEMVIMCMELKGKLRSGCFHGLGAMYSREIADVPKLLAQICLHGTDRNQFMCIEGAIEKMADFDQQTAIQVCQVLHGENKKVCLMAAHGKMYRLNKPTMDLYL